MAKSPTPPQPKPANHDAVSLRRAIDRLKTSLQEMRDFDVQKISWGNYGILDALNATIARNVEKAFGENTNDSRRFASISNNRAFRFISFDGPPSDQEVRATASEDLTSHIPLMQEAIRVLEDDLEDLADQDQHSVISNYEPVRSSTNKVFVVHGHDEAAKEQVARFLERLGIEAVILHEKANSGRTIIEKIEAFSDVDFAVVLLTPDDIGSQKDAAPGPRARQNVVLELGYFIGKLGRSQVAAFKKGDVEIPSDFLGVVYHPFDNGWQAALGKELQAGGFTVDWNLIFGKS